MAELKDIVAKKLVMLRKKNNLTQLELAEKLHYSDKAVSKWEHGDSLPAIEVLCELAELYSVTLDYLTHEGEYVSPRNKALSEQTKNNRLIIALLSISAAWVLATAVYIYGYILFGVYYWISFIWGFSASCLIALIFNLIWGRRIYSFYIVSALMWSIITGFYFQFFTYNLWAIFILGAPIQVSIILWAGLKS